MTPVAAIAGGTGRSWDNNALLPSEVAKIHNYLATEGFLRGQATDSLERGGQDEVTK